MVGIYKITNQINNKSYIGQSIDVEARLKEHVRNIKYPQKTNILYQAMRKYGVENFLFEILEECPIDNLNDREIFYIKLYDSYYNGYNATLGGKSGRTLEYEKLYEIFQQTHSIEQTAKIYGCSTTGARDALRAMGVESFHEQSDPKPVEQIDPQTLKVINEFPSIRAAAAYVDVQPSNIWAAITGETWSSGGFFWRFKGDLEKIFPSKKFVIRSKRKVHQIDIETNEIIHTFDSLAEASRSLNKEYGTQYIRQVCQNKKESVYGYKWQYAD